MPTSDNVTREKITLLLAGSQHSDWKSYRIDSDFLIPADAWQLTLGLPEAVFPADAVRGATVQVRVGTQTVLSGRVDRVQRDASRHGLILTLSGRDGAGVLVDCAAPIFSASQLGLDQAIASIVRPFGFTRIRIQAEGVTRDDKTHLEPGERAWDSLVKTAAGRGLWPWFDPDGTLVIGGPDYSRPPVATLTLNAQGTGNNVLSLSDTRSINGCFSELSMLAQGHAHHGDNLAVVDVSTPTDVSPESPAPPVDGEQSDAPAGDDTDTAQTGHHDWHYTVRDPSVPYYRPQILVAGDVNSQQHLQYKTRKAMADARLTGLDIVVEVRGHRTPDGVLWQPGQRVHIKSALHGIDEVFFLMGRSFNGGRPTGQTTTLRFKEDGIWIPDAYPKEKGQHRRHKNNALTIVPVENSNVE
jgi:prophage tail gpP-like protein